MTTVHISSDLIPVMARLATLLCVCMCAVGVLPLKYPVTYENALQYSFEPDNFKGKWISRNEYLDRYDTSVFKYSVETNESTVLLNLAEFERNNTSKVLVSADGKWIAVEHDKQSIFRHSTTSLYTLIELSSGRQVLAANGRRVQLLVWAPAGSGLAFVVDNDLYYQSEGDRNRTEATFKRITKSSRDVYNGIADWVYEEEVIEDTKALWFSPNGTKLVFATMNDTKVRNVTVWKYGDPTSLDSQYVKPIVIKYPKVGTRNPVAYLNYVDLEAETLTPEKVKAPEKLVSSDNILGPVSWAGETHFSVTWMERLQTKAFTLLCGTDTPIDCKVVYSYKETHGWLDLVAPVWVNSSAFLTVLPQDQGGNFGNYRQLSMVQDGQDTALTSGLGVVTTINCFNRHDNTVYYTSTVNGDSAKVLVYKMDLNNPEKKECFSCAVREDCAYGSASFSTDCAYAALTCEGPSIPEFNIYNADGELVQQLNNNSGLSEVMADIEVPTKRDLTVNVSDFTVRVRMLLPPNMDQSGQTKYPVLFFVYSGPNSNMIKDSWSKPGWDHYLVTKRQVIVVYLDGRGSGNRGDRLKFAIYHQLGGPEIEDILKVGQYLQKFPYVDPLRIGIWGWSYGGFATAMTLAKDYENIFRCGISVAPVTNWIYYDTVYTERYMGLPTEESNLAGYLRSSVSANVTNFHNKLFYLIHGNADDNVHYQQSMMLSRALELEDILFLQQSYPDETHALSDVRRHLYHSMDSFWTRCFHLNESDFLDRGLPVDESEDYTSDSQ